VAAQGLRGLKEGKKCEMIIGLGNNGWHGPTDKALGVGGFVECFFPSWLGF
jgi:hypothetical protein